MYDVHLRLIDKCRLPISVGFKIGIFALTLQGQFDPKFQVEEDAPTNHSSCEKAKINVLSCRIRM